MKHLHQLTLIASLLAVSGLANADLTNDPNPYAAGYGFDTPTEAAWGGWDRGDANTLYAEWDTFVDSSYPGSRTAAPDVGSAGAGNANLAWNSGTFVAGSGNLYSFSVVENFTASLSGTTSGATRAVLQFETWGIEANYSTVLLNGEAPTYTAQTYYDPAYDSSFGAVALVQYLAFWDLPSAVASYQFTFSSAEPSLSLGQVAIDIGPLNTSGGPISNVPLPAAVWMFGTGLMSLLYANRRNTLAA